MKNFQKSDIKKAVEKSGGIMSNVAALLKCDWHTANKYVDKFEMREAFTELTESIIDLAESKLIENINDNDNTAIIFYLKTKGKHRGYIERSERDYTDKTIEIGLTD